MKNRDNHLTGSGSEKPWWLKTHRFCVTKDCAAWLESAQIGPKLKEFCAFVQNKVIAEAEEDERVLYVNICSHYFKRKMHRYRAGIELLLSNGFLEENGSYSHNMTDPKGGFCKSYRLPTHCWQSGTRPMLFKARRRAFKDESHIASPELAHFLRCLQALTLRDGPLPWVENPKADALISELGESIRDGVVNVHYSKNAERCFHSVIRAPKLLRPLLIFKDSPGQAIYESDVKTCHPVLLLTLMDDPDERERYIGVLDGDIYQDISAFIGGRLERKDIKKGVLRFVNGKRERSSAARYFHAKFPNLAIAILAHPNPAVYLQKMDSDIVCRTVGRMAMERGIWFVPQHDGFLTKWPDDTVVIAGLIQDEFERLCGYRPILKTVCLNNQCG